MRFILPLAILMAAAIAEGQATPSMLPPPQDLKPGPGDIPSSKAITVAREFLRSINVDPGTLPAKAIYNQPAPDMPGNTWLVMFGDQIGVTVRAQSGRVVNYAHFKRSGEVNHARMMAVRKDPGPRAAPAFKMPPATMLLAPKCTFLDYFERKPIAHPVIVSKGWTLRVAAIEYPNGRPIVNGQSEIWLDFDPRDGTCIGFARSVDTKVPADAIKVTASQASRAASKAKNDLPNGQATSAVAKSPFLAYMFPAGERGRPDRTAPLRLVWVVPSGDKEVWVDASSAAIVGGKKFGNAPGRGGQASRARIGG